MSGWLLVFVFWAVCGSAALRDGGIDPANLGKGDWIFSIADATNKLGGHVSSVTNESSLMLYYKKQGIRYMIVKAATSDVLFRGCYGFPQFTPYLVNVAHTNGILIFGYNRSYGSNVVGEIAIADYVFNQGADGFVFDAEAEWESSSAWIGTSGPAKAWQLCSAVRSNWPTKFLAHAPFPIISFHSSFPYKEFGYWCDTVMPQIYHFSSAGIKGSPSAGINWSDVNWYNWQNSLFTLPATNINGLTVYWTNAIKPLAPINDVYGPPVSSPCEGTTSALPDKDVMEFIDYLAADPNPQTAGGYKGVSFWRTDLHGGVQWANIKAGTSGNFSGVVNNIVIDNPNAATVGSWTSTRTFYNGSFFGDGSGTDTNSFGTNYLSRPQGTGSVYVQYTPNIVVPGDYNVYEWHPSLTNASTSVPFVITYNGGSATVNANQTTNAGNWSLLGRFSFAAGTAGHIRVTDAIAEPSRIAVVDGLKLVFVPPAATPPAPSGLNATALSSSQIALNWTDNATNETGYILARAAVSGGPYSNIVTLPGGVTSYTNSGLLASTTYYYVVRATNFLGSSTNSAQAFATTQSGAPTAPTVVTPPQSQLVIAGQTAAFTVSASGSAPLHYQWRLNGSDVASATASLYSIPSAQTNDAGNYTVVITNAGGAITSSPPAVLTVHFSLTTAATAGGVVIRDPDLPSYPPGASVTLTAAPDPGFVFLGWTGDLADTNNPLSLGLETNLSLIAFFVSTATDIILDNTNPTVTFNGNWQAGTSSPDKFNDDYRFAGTIAGGLSNAVYRPYLYSSGNYDVYIWYPQGSNRATNAPWRVFYDGGSLDVAVDQTVNGGGWRLLAAARPFQSGTNGYVLLSNDTGYSGKVVLADAVRFVRVGSLEIPPHITDGPQDQSVPLGGTALFTVGASGNPLKFQWRFKDIDIPGATSSSYAQINVQLSNAGPYSVVVSNAAGTDQSSNALLNVELPAPARIDAITVLADGKYRLDVSGDPGHYGVDASSNLLDWEQLTNFFSTNSPFQFIDGETQLARRFYRVLLMP